MVLRPSTKQLTFNPRWAGSPTILFARQQARTPPPNAATMLSRRAMIASGVAAVAGSAPLSRMVRAAERPFLPQGLPEGVYDTATLEALPGKKPLIKLSYRPPNYETPLSHFTSEFTPNESFFVRYHLAGIPEEVDAAQWKLKVGGDGAVRRLELSLAALRSNFDAVEIAAVCQCSGNRRGFSEPHVAGVEWGLALLWQIFSGTGFPNQFFNDSWVVGFWRADHGRHNAELGRRASRMAQAVLGSPGP